jgi:hypothetical protein
MISEDVNVNITKPDEASDVIAKSANVTLLPAEVVKPRKAVASAETIRKRRETTARQCRQHKEIIKIHDLALDLIKNGSIDTVMQNLEDVWTPGDEMMKNVRKLSSFNSSLFCSTPSIQTSNEESWSMLARNPYSDSIIDAYCAILEINVLKNKDGKNDHCVFLPIAYGENILLGDAEGLAAAYIDSHVPKGRRTRHIFSVVSMRPLKGKQRYALVCIDLLQFIVYIFDACKQKMEEYAEISTPYISFTENLYMDSRPDPRQWTSSYFTYFKNAVPKIDAFHTGPFVCVLMDIFSANCKYSDISSYVNNSIMMGIRARLFDYMEGFHYDPANEPSAD